MITKMAALSVTAQARDTTFQFKDSCNACCWCCHTVTDQTHVYVNSKGEAVIFDASKAEDEMASLKRCISNIKSRLDQVAEASTKETLEVKTMLHAHIASLDETPAPVTMGLIARINAAIESVSS